MGCFWGVGFLINNLQEHKNKGLKYLLLLLINNNPRKRRFRRPDFDFRASQEPGAKSQEKQESPGAGKDYPYKDPPGHHLNFSGEQEGKQKDEDTTGADDWFYQAYRAVDKGSISQKLGNGSK